MMCLVGRSIRPINHFYHVCILFKAHNVAIACMYDIALQLKQMS
jgi:NADH:ubiquinone oxidoreductase subunit 3 (subunit A)